MRKPLNIPISVHSETPASLEEGLRALARTFLEWTEPDVRRELSVPDGDTLIKTTISLCPACLAHVPAAVVERGGRVLLIKRCREHGRSEALLENDIRFYRVSSKDRWGRVYSSISRVDIPAFGQSCCGPGQSCSTANGAEPREFTGQSGNKTCTVLVEITDACNLACRVCYSDSKGDRILPPESFKRHLTRMASEKGRLDSVQITGGEASLHPQFWELLDWLCTQCEVAGKIYLPTNGLLLNNPDAVARLRGHRERILVLLQFDGRDEVSNTSLRNSRLQKNRGELIAKLNRAGIAMQLTMTLSQDVSEQDIQWVARQGLKHRNVRLIALQPAFYSGRYELPADPARRLTLSDCAKGIVAGLEGRARLDDFMPIPCSHPNCGWVTLFARRFGKVVNIARHVDLDAVMNEVAYKTLLSKREVQDVVGTRGHPLKRLLARIARRLIRPQDVFGIAIKPFMDRYNYDQDRISSCCHHILDTQGNAVSFCEYNARLRHRDSWQHLPALRARAAAVPLSAE